MILISLIIVTFSSITLQCKNYEYSFRPFYHITTHKGHSSYVDGLLYHDGTYTFYHHVNYNHIEMITQIYWAHL